MERPQDGERPLRIEVVQRDDLRILRLEGELDMASVPVLEQALHPLQHVEAKIVVDLRGLTFMDSMGRSALLTAQMRGRDGDHEISFIRGDEGIQKVFRITRMDEAIAWVDPTDRDEPEPQSG